MQFISWILCGLLACLWAGGVAVEALAATPFHAAVRAEQHLDVRPQNSRPKAMRNLAGRARHVLMAMGAFGHAMVFENGGLSVRIRRAQYRAQRHLARNRRLRRQQRLQRTAETWSELGAKLGGVLFSAPPTFDRVHQGPVGDCWVIAAVAAAAKFQPERVAQMITTHADGTYSVALHADWQHPATAVDPIRVDRTVPAYSLRSVLLRGGGQRYARSGNAQEHWVTILEKAVAKSQGGFQTIAHGGWPAKALAILTGQNPEVVYIHQKRMADANAPVWSAKTRAVLEVDAVWTLVQGGVVRRALMVAGSRSIFWTLTLGAFTGLVGNHAYAITGVSQEHGQRFVHLFNPWGKRFFKRGAFKLTVEEFQKYFFRVDYVG